MAQTVTPLFGGHIYVQAAKAINSIEQLRLASAIGSADSFDDQRSEPGRKGQRQLLPASKRRAGATRRPGHRTHRGRRCAPPAL